MGVNETLVISNDLKEMARVGTWVSEVSASAGLSDSLTFKLDLCAAEAVTNVIDYAFADSVDHRIMLELINGDSHVELVLEDNGTPFNPLEVSQPEQADSLEEAQIGGLGIHLFRTYTDECHYERDNGINRLRMILRKDQAPRQASTS